MRTVGRNYWLKALIVSFTAFLFASAAYIAIGIIIANRTPDASAAHHQITVLPLECDCIIKFVPENPLAGSGVSDDPYVTYSSTVPIVVGISGTGHVTITDSDDNVLFSYNKTQRGYEEVIAQIDLTDGVGGYNLIVKIDDIEKTDDDTNSRIALLYKELPLPPIAPPNTGGHIYVAGYATQTFGVLLMGSVFFAIVFGMFIIGAARRKKRQTEIELSQAKQNRRARREFAPTEIKQFAKTRKNKKR